MSIWGVPHPDLQDTPSTNPDLVLFLGHIVKMKNGIAMLIML